MKEPLPESALENLPVFPLPNVVFFPGTRLPLHFFEPRYRRLVEDCVAGEGAMAVALLLPGWEEQYEERPPWHPVAGAGRIVSHHPRPDGTHDVVLEGVHVVSLEELPPEGLPYRRARATVLADRDEAAVTAADRAALVGCATALARTIRERHRDFSFAFEGDAPAGEIADIIADRVVVDPETRQHLLALRETPRRVTEVVDVLGQIIARLAEHPEGPFS